MNPTIRIYIYAVWLSIEQGGICMGISGRDDCVAKNSHTLPRQSNRAARKSFAHKLLCSRTEYIYIYGTFWNCLKILYIYILFRLNVVACRRLKGFNKLLYQYTQHVSTLIISSNHPICLAHKYINLSHDRTFYSIKRFALQGKCMMPAGKHRLRWRALCIGLWISAASLYIKQRTC